MRIAPTETTLPRRSCGEEEEEEDDGVLTLSVSAAAFSAFRMDFMTTSAEGGTGEEARALLACAPRPRDLRRRTREGAGVQAVLSSESQL